MRMSSSSDLLLPIVAATAAATVTAVVALQTDYVSRMILNPSRLSAKRRDEYTYHWRTELEKAHLQLDYYLAGSPQTLHDDPEVVFKQTEYLASDHDLESLVHRILKEEESKFVCLKIDKDPNDPRGEFYLFLLEDVPSKGIPPQLYQVPLMMFGMKLAKAFEDKLTTTTFCFVADASSGKATSLLEQLVRESKTGVAILSEPLWMIQLARLVEAQIFPTAKIQKLMFGLCRLDAWSLRDQAKDSRTVMITLPGQSTVSTLLPLVQQAFPEDRHVYAYDGCVASVQRGVLARKNFTRGIMETRLRDIINTMCHNPIRHTTPLPSNSPLTKSLVNLEDALAQLPVGQAQVVEAWMSSVDTYFKMKEGESTNGYLPYVFKLGFLSHPEDRDFTPKSDSHWSLSSLLQYITGTRSRPVSEGVMDAAIEFLKDFNRDNQMDLVPIHFSDEENKLVENCVFQHKSILIGNKTLQDTVLPTQHWTLKQASKNGGCACCGPDPFDEEEEEEARKANGGMNMSVTGAFAMNGTSSTQKTDYVDGKMGFAFDPSRFS
jgi:hypothetical protein